MSTERSLGFAVLLVLASGTLGVSVSGCGSIEEEEAPPATPATLAEAPPGPPPGSVQEVAVDPKADVYADTDPSALTDFHAALDAHGTWVDDPTYGTVWVPAPAEVGPDFQPYQTAGHWAYDDADYVWYSDYDWGWAPFHYGRWMYGGVGWVWVPGREYSPAWVSWRVGEPGFAYVGWAPMSAGFYWRGGVAITTAPLVVGPGAYSYCAHGDLFAPSIGARVVARGEVAGIAAHTTGYGGGPGRMGHGPEPRSLGIAPGAVVHASANDHQSQMAKGFAHPSTAKAMGGHAPTPHRVVAGAHRAAHPAVHGHASHGGSHGHR